jgi:HIRAN domain
LTMLGMKYNGISPAQHEQLFRPGVTRVFLHREADNAHDDQQQPRNNTNTKKKKKIGYVDNKQAKLLSPWIDRGLVVIVNDEHDDADGRANNSTVDGLTSATAIELSRSSSGLSRCPGNARVRLVYELVVGVYFCCCCCCCRCLGDESSN